MKNAYLIALATSLGVTMVATIGGHERARNTASPDCVRVTTAIDSIEACVAAQTCRPTNDIALALTALKDSREVFCGSRHPR